MKILGMNDTIYTGSYAGAQVKDLVYETGVIFSIIKYSHLAFDDEVLKEAHIKKIIRN